MIALVRLNKPTTGAMEAALDMARQHGGKLVRHVGGYWTWPEAPISPRGVPIEHVGATTVAGLVRRGIMQYSQWREGRHFRFPIEAELLP